jgi:hypothetical protein
MTKEAEDFEAWLIDMDDALERFMSEVPQPVSAQLDYTATALDVFENWLLGAYGTIEKYKNDSSTTIYDGCARYVGETYRRVLGGRQWSLCVRKKSPYFHLPILSGPSVAEECPHSLVTASLDRRTGAFMRSVLENSRNP